MIKFKKVLLGCIGLYMFAALPLAGAQNAPVISGPSPQWHSGQGIFNQLNLTDAQKKQLEANRQQHRARMEGIRQEMKTDRQALQDELMKPQLDMPRIKALDEQIKGLQGQMEEIRLNSILTVRGILTPDQFAKFVNMMHKHKQEHDQ